MLEGIDVSHWQASTPNLTGLSFLIAKATEGTTRDPLYSTHIRNARTAGLVVGAYHFARNDVQVAAQVNAFLAAVAGVPWLAFDVEGAHAWSLAQTRQAIDQVHGQGLEVGLYMSASKFFDAGQDWDWVANWAQQPARHWDLWQYRGSPQDRDRYDGTIDQLRTLAHQEDPMTQLPITSTTPMLVTLPQPADFYDLDGKLLSGGHKVLQSLVSPYEATSGATHFRAIYAGPRLVLVKPATKVPLPPDGAPVPTSYPVTVGGKPAGEVTLP